MLRSFETIRFAKVATKGFEGSRLLIVEDESMVAMLIEDMLLDMGCVVAGVASAVDDAIGKISTINFDAAIVDLNLDGRPSYPVAFALMKKSVPLLLCTGYGATGVPEELSHVLRLAKPFQQADLERALSIVLAQAGGMKAR